MTSVLAIDPGLSGAVAYYDGTALDVEDIPTEIRNRKPVVDLPRLWVLVSERWPDARNGVIENVNGMARQTGAGNFGKTIGACEMALVAAFGAITRVSPPTWKFGVGIAANPDADKKARKNASRAKAIELFPEHAHLFARVKDDGRAEAALMAWWFIHKRNAT
jgi:crossover junction endodeoxyribonuclease RuvC